VLEDVSSLSSCCCFPMQVKPALLLARFPPPPSGAAVFTGLHSACARCTSNAGISTVVKCIVGHAVRLDVRPHVVRCPFEQWIEFQQAIGVIPALGLKILPIGRLLAPQAGDPALLAGQCTLQRPHLANLAALKPL